MNCRSVCITKYGGRRTAKGYASGYKWCSDCAASVKWYGIHCPCCGQRLRSSPKNSRYRLGPSRPRVDDGEAAP